jgi:5-formyltetrahydrofolate cyclo-ligase
LNQRQAFSSALCEIVRSQEVWQQAKAILLYSPLPDEPNISALLPEALAAGKIVALPKFNRATGHYLVCRITHAEKVAPGKFGIHEPHDDCEEFPLKRLDFALVPGVGFDTMGARLGRGRGFYDRLLAQMDGIKCGVAFDDQVVNEIPVAQHDMKMNFVLTPTRWLACGLR